MRKLIKALENIDYDDLYGTKRVLKNIHNDIFYFSSRGKKRGVQDISRVLNDFLSTNETQGEQNRKKFFLEISRLARTCDDVG